MEQKTSVPFNCLDDGYFHYLNLYILYLFGRADIAKSRCLIQQQSCLTMTEVSSPGLKYLEGGFLSWFP